MDKVWDCNSAHDKMSVDEMLELIRHAPPGPWPLRKKWVNGKMQNEPEFTWACWENTQEAMRILRQEFVDGIGKLERPEYKGRGIVMCGGAQEIPHRGLSHGYLPCIWVAINKIRMLGCQLPIQLWYLGDLELDPAIERLLAPLGVECIDGREMEKKYPCRIHCGWEAKMFATMWSSFEEVLFLDADCAPVTYSPDELFDHPDYVAKGAVFWPDFGHWQLKDGVWNIFGIPPRNEPAFETGQFMVNKGKCWAEMRLALWYAEYSDFVFEHVYGDKECPHLAWRFLGTDYAIPSKGPDWVGSSCIVQHDLQGRRALLHRCGDKWKLNGGNKFIKELEDEQVHHDLAKSLRGVWNGRLWENPNPSETERAIANRVMAQKWSYARLPKEGFAGDSREISFDPGFRVGDGSAECERRWSVFEVAFEDGNRAVMSLCRENKPTCLLTEGEDGIWRGSWLEYEKADVELRPVPVTVSKEKAIEECEIALRRHGLADRISAVRDLLFGG